MKPNTVIDFLHNRRHPLRKQAGGAATRWLILLLLVATAVLLVALFWEGEERRPISQLALAVQPLASADAPSMSAIPQSDLPPEGTRSLFDHVIANNEALPYPFEDLVALLQQQNADLPMTESVLIPDGRSLLKAQADFSQPRIITAAQANAAHSEYSLGAMFKGRLFMGFVEGANEIELISYNEQAGRFEYQLVKDYCLGCTPKIVYAKRALCTTCHTNQATIFSQRPWEETNAQPVIAAEITAARDSDQPYQGVLTKSSLAIAERIDNLTEIANTIVTTQRIWLDGCGAGNLGQTCRSAMLKLALQFALSPGNFDPDSADVKRLQELQARQWPDNGIVHASGDIASRDPFSARAHGGGLRGFINSLFGRDVIDDAPAENDLAAFEKLPPLPEELDPLSPKTPNAIYSADTLEGIYGVAQLLSAADVALLEQMAPDINRILAAVDAESVQAELKANNGVEQPFRRVNIINGLLTALGKTPVSSCCTSTTDMSAPILDGEPPLELAADSPLQPFADYCFACHRGNPSARLNFMSGDSEAAVLEKIKATESIRDALDYDRYLGTDKTSTLMPPASSWQRTQMDAARRDGANPHEAMREQVPDLFGF